MKLNENFILRRVADTWVAVPVGAASRKFHGMLQLNESGVELWHALEQGADEEALIQLLCKEYAVAQEQACADVEAFLSKLRTAGCILD